MEGDEFERIRLRNNPLAEVLILTTLALMAVGVVMVSSTAGAWARGCPWYYRRDIKQVIFAALSVIILLGGRRFDYHWLVKPFRRIRGWKTLIFSPAGIFLLSALVAAVVVLILPVGTRGAFRRWIRFGPVGFQPSELLKFALLIFLSAYMSRSDVEPGSFTRAFIPAVVLISVSLLLVAPEDFGTGVIIALSSVVLLIMAGVRWYYFLTLVPPAVGGFYWFVVHCPYRWARIQAMLDPFDLSNPAAYQARQSLICIATGWPHPAGLGAGTAKYGYLPEISTDFIFANLCQETGIIGAAGLVLLWLVWLILVWRISLRAPDRFASLLTGAIGFLIVLQVLMHIAVTVVWMPPTGVSLPFVSAGGSSLIMCSFATALIVSVGSHKTRRSISASVRPACPAEVDRSE